MDTLSKIDRSRNMSRIRSKNTRPEMAIRHELHAHGYRFHVHDESLPGKPDIVFSKRRKAVFVHGCFWHCHSECRISRQPKSHIDYWNPKLEKNQKRDIEHISSLNALGWQVFVAWECETKKIDDIVERIEEFLGPQRYE